MQEQILGRNSKFVILRGGVSDKTIKYYEAIGFKVIVLFGTGGAK